MKKTILTFLISLLVTTGYLTVKLIQVYYTEFSAGHTTWEIFELTGYGFLMFAGSCLPASVLLAYAIHYQQFARINTFPKFKKILPGIALVALLCFIYYGFVMPRANLYTFHKLYTMRTAKYDPLAKIPERSSFKNSWSNANYIELHNWIDSVKQDKNLLTPPKGIFLIESLPQQLRKARIQYWEMTAFPFVVFISACLGISIGLMNRHNKTTWMVFGLVLFVLPIFHYTIFFCRTQTKNEHMPIVATIGIPLLLLAIPTLLLYRRALKKHAVQSH